MDKYITVDIDEKFPIYEMVDHTEDEHPECAVLVTEKTYGELKRIQREWTAAQRYLKEALEVQKIKWAFQQEDSHECE